jgi:uncharacterized membrane protein
LRTVFPRRLLSSTSGARVVHGNGLQRIVADEQASAASFESDRRQIRDAIDHIWRTILILLALGLGPALLIAGAVYFLFGRERHSTYDREYEQEPPSELEPALVPPLLRQSTSVGSNEFTATLFDLIRRKRYKATPVTTEAATWGGLKKEDVADLEITKGEDAQLTPFEQDVADVVDAVVAAGPERLSKFRDRISADRTENAKRFQAFKKAVESAVKQLRWFEDGGARILALAIGICGLAAVILLWVGIDGFRAVAPRWNDIVLIALGACAVVNAVILVFAAARVSMWRRRRPKAETEAERWDAFRRYLTDFPRLKEAPPATLELWERYLVYGITLGIAERVLQGAQLHMPEELHQASTIYWISPSGDLGSGATALGISDLSAGFGSAL